MQPEVKFCLFISCIHFVVLFFIIHYLDKKTTGVWISEFELMYTSRLMSCKKIILLVILDWKVDFSSMYKIALHVWLSVESSASLLSHPFILNFLVLGFCFPHPRP